MQTNLLVQFFFLFLDASLCLQTDHAFPHKVSSIPCYEIHISWNNLIGNSSGTLHRWLLTITRHSDCEYASFTFLTEGCKLVRSSVSFFRFNTLTGINKVHPRPKHPENNRWSLAI